MSRLVLALTLLLSLSAHAFDDLLVDHAVQAGAPEAAVKKALDYLEKNPALFKNKNFVMLVDFSRKIGEDRMYLLNLKTSDVERMRVSHGHGSDPQLTGLATLFSNREGSNMSSLGFYRTLTAYTGQYGYSLRVQGLSDTNDQALRRAIVVHGYDIGPDYDRDLCRRNYVAKGEPQKQKYCLEDGRLTQGCFGISRLVVRSVVDRIKDGALIYAFN